MKKPLQIIAVLALAVALACCSRSTSPDENDEVSYPLRTTPENVLEKLRLAYANMDLEPYLDCFAEEFLFFVSEADQGNPGNPLPAYWDVVTEEMIHAAMWDAESNVDSIAVVLTEIASEYDPGADPGSTADDRWIVQMGVDVRIYIPIPGDVFILLVTGDQTFVLQVDPNELGPEGEALWEIAEWWDAHEGRPSTEDTSWAGVKALYWERPYPLRSTPESVLEKLRLAYGNMDLEPYLDCLAEDFLFYTSEADQGDPGNPLPEFWDRATEETIHANMWGEETDVDRITLLMAEISSEFDEGDDPVSIADDRWTFLMHAHLRVYIPIPGDELILLVTSDQEFVLQVDPDEVGAMGEALWEIVEWREIDSGHMYEDATWGGIKALYR